jgi:hypothetical protein
MGSRGVHPGLSRQIQETLVSPLECGVHPKLIYSYASKEKGAVEHDIDVERDWKQFIKNLDPEKKTAQACFTSLVYVRPIVSRHVTGLIFRLQEHPSVLDIMFIGLDLLCKSLGLLGITIHPMLELLDVLAQR